MFMAARLHEAGAEVSLIARGPHLEAIQKTGLRLTYAGQDRVISCRQQIIRKSSAHMIMSLLP